jgi:hypothetical protein
MGLPFFGFDGSGRDAGPVAKTQPGLVERRSSGQEVKEVEVEIVRGRVRPKLPPGSPESTGEEMEFRPCPPVVTPSTRFLVDRLDVERLGVELAADPF